MARDSSLSLHLEKMKWTLSFSAWQRNFRYAYRTCHNACPVSRKETVISRMFCHVSLVEIISVNYWFENKSIHGVPFSVAEMKGKFPVIYFGTFYILRCCD